MMIKVYTYMYKYVNDQGISRSSYAWCGLTCPHIQGWMSLYRTLGSYIKPPKKHKVMWNHVESRTVWPQKLTNPGQIQATGSALPWIALERCIPRSSPSAVHDCRRSHLGPGKNQDATRPWWCGSWVSAPRVPGSQGPRVPVTWLISPRWTGI